jgi:hypothetical protein
MLLSFRMLLLMTLAAAPAACSQTCNIASNSTTVGCTASAESFPEFANNRFPYGFWRTTEDGSKPNQS